MKSQILSEDNRINLKRKSHNKSSDKRRSKSKKKDSEEKANQLSKKVKYFSK